MTKNINHTILVLFVQVHTFLHMSENFIEKSGGHVIRYKQTQIKEHTESVPLQSWVSKSLIPKQFRGASKIITYGLMVSSIPCRFVGTQTIEDICVIDKINQKF